MPPRLTDEEKARRGTLQPVRVRAPRPLTEVEAEIAQLNSWIADLDYIRDQARKLLSDGITVTVTTRTNQGHHITTQKLHPALKAHTAALTELKQLRRMLVLLDEERSAAREVQATITAQDELSDLD